MIEPNSATRIGGIGEQAILDAILPILTHGNSTPVGPGDDAAVIDFSGGTPLVSTDMLVEDFDFRRRTFSWFNVGWKAAAVNLSDIAAMGGVPSHVTVALAMPSSLRLGDVVEIAKGLKSACVLLSPSCQVIGGDLSAADKVVLAVTALGTSSGAPVLRSGARVGDGVYVAGALGLAAAGFGILERSAPGKQFDARAAEAIRRQMRPQPPISVGSAAAAAGATAMMDISDGLAIDAGRIAHASNVTVDLDPHAIAPIVAKLGWLRYEYHLDPWQLVMAGGEDFALLATFEPGAVDIPSEFTRIGTAVAPGESRVTLGGQPVPYSGWDHFAGGDSNDRAIGGA